MNLHPPEVVAHTGVSCNYSFESAPYTWEIIENFNGGTAVFTNPSSPIKCGGAPNKIMYLACDYWKKKGILHKCDVHYVSGAGVIFGVPEYAKTLQDIVKEFGIKTHFQSNTHKIDPVDRKIFFTTKQNKEALDTHFNKTIAGCYAISENQDDSGALDVSMNFDFCHAVPPQSAPDFIKNTRFQMPIILMVM